MPYFHNDKIGVVQTRWEHLNEDYSLLTKLQAFQLNVHFTVEQAGRCAAGHFYNSMVQQESGEELQSTKLEDGIQIH